MDIGCWLLDICTFPHFTRKEHPMKPFAVDGGVAYRVTLAGEVPLLE